MIKLKNFNYKKLLNLIKIILNIIWYPFEKIIDILDTIFDAIFEFFENEEEYDPSLKLSYNDVLKNLEFIDITDKNPITFYDMLDDTAFVTGNCIYYKHRYYKNIDGIDCVIKIGQ